MTLFGIKIPLVFSLAVWFGLWEIVGRAGLSSIVPPFSSVIDAMFTVVRSDPQHRPASSMRMASAMWLISSPPSSSLARPRT